MAWDIDDYRIRLEDTEEENKDLLKEIETLKEEIKAQREKDEPLNNLNFTRSLHT